MGQAQPHGAWQRVAAAAAARRMQQLATRRSWTSRWNSYCVVKLVQLDTMLQPWPHWPTAFLRKGKLIYVQQA
eukprot:2391981-Heterocapsa_arctica.AAC.1